MGIFAMIGRGFALVGKAAMFPVKSVRGSHTASLWFRWTMHLLCLAGVLVGLAILNQAVGLESVVRSPWPALRALWLPLLFVLVYALAWFAWWLRKLLAMPRQESPHPDIDAAWNEALAALDHAGISLERTPLFLILGRTAAPEPSLMTSTGLAFTVSQTPRGKDAPLHVSANEQGIYVTIAENSLLGRQAELFAAHAAEESRLARLAHRGNQAASFDSLPSGDWATEGFDSASDFNARGANSAVESLDALQQGLADFSAASDSPAPTQSAPAASSSPVGSATAVLAPPTAPAAAPRPRHAAPRLLKEIDEIEAISARLRYVCSLIVRTRRPYAPINGVLCLVPLAATEGATQANQTAVLLQRDLDTLREGLQVRAPLYLLVCDLEQAPGCRQLLERFPEEQRHRRLGAMLPYLAPCDHCRAPEVAAQALQWVIRSLIPALAYRLVRFGQPGQEVRDHQGNVRIYQFVDSLRQREPRLQRIVERGVLASAPYHWQLQGCFLAATGCDAVREQGFAEGFFPQLLDTQDQLAWSEVALAEDLGCRRWTTIGWTSLGIFLLLTALMLWGF